MTLQTLRAALAAGAIAVMMAACTTAIPPVTLSYTPAEIEARLVEEVDYRRELKRIDEFRAFYSGREEILIPKPVPELSSQRVLSTELLMGFTIEEARKHGQQEKNAWGRLLFRSLAEQLLVFRQIQSDPNPANYAFRDGGKLILYDFGSIKELPDWLHKGYLDTIAACREGRFEDLRNVLVSLQVKLKSGEPVPYKHVQLFREALSPVFAEKPYRFTADRDPIKKIVTYNRENFNELKEITFPGDVLFIDRAIMGLVGNLTGLGAEGHWADELMDVLKQ